MNDCLTTPQHKHKSAIECQTIGWGNAFIKFILPSSHVPTRLSLREARSHRLRTTRMITFPLNPTQSNQVLTIFSQIVTRS